MPSTLTITQTGQTLFVVDSPKPTLIVQPYVLNNSANFPDIDLRKYGLPMDGTSSCVAAIELAKTQNPSGGTLCFPAGTFVLPTNIDLTGAAWCIRGSGAWATNILATNNIAGTAFVLRTDMIMQGLRLVGPFATDKNSSTYPLRSGLNMRDRVCIRDCRIENFLHGIQIDGNHQRVDNVIVTNCRYNIAWAQNSVGYTTSSPPSFTHGNQVITHVQLAGAGEASIFVDGNSKIDSSTLMQVHMGFCRIGIQLAPKGSQEMAIGNTSFHECSFESIGDTYINDLGWNTTNRRMTAYLKWFNPLTGPQDPSYSNSGGGIEMFKLGKIIDWEIFGRVGDDSNTSFGSVGWGTTSTACGFRVEYLDGLYFHDADTLFNNSNAQLKPMFRLEGAQLAFGNCVLTVYKRYKLSVGLAAVNLTSEYIVQPNTITNGDPWAQGFGSMKLADGTGAAIGRVCTPAGISTAGYLVPFVIDGALNGPPTAAADNAILPGDPLTVDSAHPGWVKKYTGTGQIVGTALKASSGGVVTCYLKFAWSQIL